MSGHAKAMKEPAVDVNDLLQIRFPDDPLAISCQSRVDDTIEGKILIAWPTELGVHVPIHQHQILTISFIRDDAVYTFTAIVEETQTIPFPQLAVRAAGPCERIQRRQFFRAKLVVPVDFFGQAASSDQGESTPKVLSFKAHTYDLSGSGLSIRQKTSVPTGTVLEAKLMLPGEQSVIKVLCKVVHCSNLNASTEESLYHLGMHFLSIREPDRTLIVRHVFRSQMRQ
jgi:c-di-GMP-binding flagellar brake protein YcgR